MLTYGTYLVKNRQNYAYVIYEWPLRKGVEIQRGEEFVAFLSEMEKQVIIMTPPIQCRKMKPFSCKKSKI